MQEDERAGERMRDMHTLAHADKVPREQDVQRADLEELHQQVVRMQWRAHSSSEQVGHERRRGGPVGAHGDAEHMHDALAPPQLLVFEDVALSLETRRAASKVAACSVSYTFTAMRPFWALALL